jgi:HEAT repeat protein
VTRLCEELVNAKCSDQLSILARWREGSGSDLTDALVLALPKLPETLRTEAEGALRARLSHLATAALRDKLQDDNVELRRAAAFACGRKLAKELIPDLVQLLQDPEKDVIQAARAALTELTGEDFGPSAAASAAGRAEAVAAWQKWCKEHAGTSL